MTDMNPKESVWKRWFIPETVIKLIGFGIMLMMFFWRTNSTVLLYVQKTDQRLQFLENYNIAQNERNQKASDLMVTLTDSLKSFRENSDGYHSSVLSTQFYNGRPIDPGFDSRRVAKILSTRGEAN